MSSLPPDNSPKPPSERKKSLGMDEWIAIIVALATFGPIFFWILAKKEPNTSAVARSNSPQPEAIALQGSDRVLKQENFTFQDTSSDRSHNVTTKEFESQPKSISNTTTFPLEMEQLIAVPTETLEWMPTGEEVTPSEAPAAATPVEPMPGHGAIATVEPMPGHRAIATVEPMPGHGAIAPVEPMPGHGAIMAGYSSATKVEPMPGHGAITPVEPAPEAVVTQPAPEAVVTQPAPEGVTQSAPEAATKPALMKDYQQILAPKVKEDSTTLSPQPIALDSEEGEKLLTGSSSLADYLPLAMEFLSENNSAYSGVASAVMVLNALEVPAPSAPGLAEQYGFFTQENVFDNPEARKILSPEAISAKGMTLKQLTRFLRSYGVPAEAYYGSDIDLDDFRQKLVENLQRSDNFVLVNYLRDKIGQEAGGHFSPVAAYNEESDRFLILDVSRYKYPPVWVTAEELWMATATFDLASYKTRGFVTVGNNN